ncbi:MAG: heavy metal-binding domain-containing protein [Saprospiraceae bacterium]
MESLNDTIKSNLDIMPVVSTHLPLGWEYDIIGMVTAQSVSGTGIFTEGSSAVDDFFGTQSVALSNKLKGGENFCFSLLRKRALDMGANAVIATDIDYAELGTLKGMIMVCMAGTAIRLKNLNILGDSKVKEMDLITISNERFRKLQALKVAIA